jgi:hypothetical protein
VQSTLESTMRMIRYLTSGIDIIVIMNSNRMKLMRTVAALARLEYNSGIVRHNRGGR